ncbi:MAG TPA: RNA polymerase subunit sigma-70, partial [Polyangiaceae bacterium]|nr:RNA polymerase subunit sigma-70 [Polyangiaceae bacterium]
ERAFGAMIAPYRRELRAYCYRMAGSIDDADDLLQESLLRAWRGLPTFDGRASLRTWLYRVASSACIDRLKNRTAKKRVEDERPPAHAPTHASDDAPPGDMNDYLGPCPPEVYAGEPANPEARYDTRESIGFAFLAALQLLPPKQRATLIACDVLGFSADECATVLETSASSVESALRRAREAVDERAKTWSPAPPNDDATRLIVSRWVDAWDRADANALITLLHDDATMTMPPLPMWMRGPEAIGASLGAMVFARQAPGDFRSITVEANGLPALGVYRRDEDGGFLPFALHVLGADAGKVRAFTAFVDTRVFPFFGLPDH